MERQFKSRDIIFLEGDYSDNAYVIMQGSVEILKHGDNGEVQLALLGPGSVFGEMGLFMPQSARSATARAVEPTVVDIISAGEFGEMLSACPARILPIFENMVDRLRVTNQRLSSVEQATVLLDSDIDKILLKPASEAAQKQFSAIEIPIARLPFKIGGFPAGNATAINSQNHLNIGCEGSPLLISKNHCEISVEENTVTITDMGSRFGTVVNGRPIGQGKGQYKLPLQQGENQVILGGNHSPFAITLECR